MNVKIIDANGWSKLFEIKKAITQMGSAAYVDIQLPLDTIPPLQLQILANPALPTSCRIVNMADKLEIRSNNTVQILESHKTYDVNSGDEIQLGDFRIIFLLPLITVVQQTSESISASLSFQDTILQPHLSLDGLFTVKNTGGKDGCQFQVEIAGLPEDCYRIDPIPLLYSGAQEEVRIRLFHNITYPPAGFQNLQISIKAPDTYPGETVLIKQGVFIAPVFNHSIEINETPAPAIQVTSKFQNEEPVQTEIITQSDVQIIEQSEPLTIPEMEQKTENLLPEPVREERIEPTPIQNNEPMQTEDQIKIANEEPERVTKPKTSKTKKNKKIQPVNEFIPPNEHEDIFAETKPAEKNDPSISQELDLRKVKVIRKQTEQYWDEK